MMKKSVIFIATNDNYIKVGSRAIIQPVDHPDCSNREPAITSVVEKINSDGSFETANSVYRPKMQLNG